MNNYVTAQTIKCLREKRGITQTRLAEELLVSDKTVSKWETAKGLPDISLIEPLAKALNVSVAELMSGNITQNKNISSNIKKAKFYVCPVCGNVISSVGEALVSCCGITLPAVEAEENSVDVKIETIENEYFISINHPMEKEHYISFIALVSSDRIQFLKLYPEGNPEARFDKRDRGILYYYCNKHGLEKQLIK